MVKTIHVFACSEAVIENPKFAKASGIVSDHC